jgi:hypothetical protein
MNDEPTRAVRGSGPTIPGPRAVTRMDGEPPARPWSNDAPPDNPGRPVPRAAEVPPRRRPWWEPRQVTTHGYDGAAETSGRPIGELGYWIALAVTAGADVAAFDQVVSLVMQEQEAWLIWLMVAGFTASSLTLAHFAGRLARDITAGRGPANWAKVWLLIIPWALVGLVALVVRLIVADQDAANTTVVTGVGQTASDISSAIMFGVVYVASGAVAGFGVYLTRNPVRVGYRRALRHYRRALMRLARSQPPYERALSVLQLHMRGREREAQNYAAARAQRLAFADELKRYAAVLIATHLQDPSATDGMTLPDRRPPAQPGPDPNVR